ncbi:MAG: flagellar assembly protein FliW, partial [Acidobacteriota bacterium]
MMPAVLKSIRFGEISFDPEDIVGFEEGMPGFEGLKRFVLIESQDFAPMKFFQAVDDPNISFPLLPPQTVCQDYQLKIPPKQRRELGLERPEEAAVLCVVTIDEDPGRSTINLFAP